MEDSKRESESPRSSNGISSKSVRISIIILSAVILLGYLIILMMIPDNISRPFLTAIRDKLNTTYLGFQGGTILIFCFPILLIAVMGCVYLHLLKISNHTTYQRNRILAKWKKPMIVKGPLGIVSGVELTCFVMFIALLIWYFSARLYNDFATRLPQFAAMRHEKIWEAKMEWIAFMLGVVGNIALTFLFVPVTRGSSLLPMLGLTSEGSIKFHIWLGHLVMVLFTAHGLGYIIYWVITNNISEMVKWSKTRVSNVAGELSLLAGLGLWVTTFPRIRQRMFELFFYSHHLYILFMVFFVYHLGVNFSVLVMLPGFYLFLIDRYLRFLQSRSSVRLVSARVLPCQTLELNFSKAPSLSYSPTSIFFINVPTISKLQWHPFTISSSSNLENDTLSVMIKSEGTWSSKLYQMLSSPNSPKALQVSVEGPHGPTSTQFLRHETLVMVSGGSGITPFISIIRELIHQSTTNKCKIPQVILICAFKNSSDLTMLDLILPISSTPFSTSQFKLKIEAFVTREKKPEIQDSKIQTVWFEPHINDKPISSTLGPNSWIWLGFIISSSFVIFLIIIGLITRYYIYPIDHNTFGRGVFPRSIQSSIYMLVICVSIVIAASVAFLWNKKQNEREIKRIGDTDPKSWLQNSDKELGGLPFQPFEHSTNVHYGERPDLKRMLSECKGSSVGVLVCGPKQMRHDVASICSSGFIKNLHFESISFSW